MDERSLEQWFSDLKRILEEKYLAAAEPWKQSGFSGPEARWIACRRPIADCIDTPGRFLDIGCANGYLLECLVAWTAEKGISIIPYGIDLSEKLIAHARKRLQGFEDHLFVANGLTWEPPRRFDYVRTELCYVPEELQAQFVKRIIQEFLVPDGKLLVAEYRSRGDTHDREWVDVHLEQMGFRVQVSVSGSWEGRELTRIAVVRCSEARGGSA